MTRALLFFFPVGSKEDDSKGGLFALCTLDGTQHFILGWGGEPCEIERYLWKRTRTDVQCMFFGVRSRIITRLGVLSPVI